MKVIKKYYKCPECGALNESITEEGGQLVPKCNRPGMCSRHDKSMELISSDDFKESIGEIEARAEGTAED